MCGRFALKAPPSELITHFGLDECAEFGPRYNIPPGTDTPVIRQSPDGKRVSQLLRWGLIPHWAKDPLIGNKLNNARGESLADKPSFSDAFRRRRCLIPASGFFEWKTDGKVKTPYYFQLKSAEPLALGGLWESWTSPEGEIVRTFCVITTKANELMTPIHERMPVIIHSKNFGKWLDFAVEGNDLKLLVAPFPTEALETWPVSKAVSRTGNDGPELLART
jgi:putative SOS response-associated peptidase YedK